MSIQFKGASAIVTGGASGIGLAIATALAERGARVVVADLHLDRAETVAADLRQRGFKAMAAAVDVTDRASFEALAVQTEMQFGRIDFLFNNAGVLYIGDWLDMDEAACRHMIDVNLWGVLHGIRSVYPRMVQQRSGCIVNTASITGLAPAPGFSVYVATKHAVVGLSRSLRGEARQHGVQVNALCPGFVRTPMMMDGNFVAVNAQAALQELMKVSSFATPEQVVRDMMRGIERNQALIVTTRFSRMAMTLVRLFPFLAGPITDRLIQTLRSHRHGSSRQSP